MSEYPNNRRGLILIIERQEEEIDNLKEKILDLQCEIDDLKSILEQEE